MEVPVIDLHCDLLAYLRLDPKANSPLDAISNCSIPLLEKGGVHLQTLALWSETKKGTFQIYQEQLAAYHQMLRDYGDRVAPISEYENPKKKVCFVLAIENASLLLEEDEPFERLERRLEAIKDPLLYVSLTWNDENRFGGGNLSHQGLKRDGEMLIELLTEKKIAIDLSHTSDHLAFDILNLIHKKGLSASVLASHSNFRAVLDCPRNLPDEVAKEIGHLGGVIGINFFRPFVGEKDEDFLKHIEHGMDLLGEDVLALGADFFGGIETPTLASYAPFYLSFNNSSCYPHFFRLLEKQLTNEQIKKIAHLNVEKLLKKLELIHN